MRNPNFSAKEEFLRAYDKYADGILRHAYFRIGNRELAEDLTQDTFFKVWNRISKNNENIKNFKTFLYKVADNLIIDYYRKKPRIPVSIEKINPESAACNPNQVREAEKIINKSAIEKSLMELDEKYREIIIYRYINDLTIKEICEITGKSANSVSVIIFRGLKLLKEKIQYV